MSGPNDESCAASAIKIGAISTGAGLAVSAIQNSLATHTHGAKGVFTRTGGTVGFFAAMGGVFAATECIAKQVRQVDDPWNNAIAGCAAGLITGIRAHSVPTMCGACVTIGSIFAAYDYAGGNIKGTFAQLPEEERRKLRESFFQKKNERKDE